MAKRLINLSDIKPHPVRGTQQAATKDAKLGISFLGEQYKRIESVKALIGSPPGQGECLFLWTDKSFNSFTFVTYLLKEYSLISELTISTYAINKRILMAFMKLVEENKLLKIHLLVADSLKHQRPKVSDLLSGFATSNPQLTIHYAWNHSKIMLAKCQDNHYVVEGSGNWSENSRHEQYLFANNDLLYNFRMDCIKKVVY